MSTEVDIEILISLVERKWTYENSLKTCFRHTLRPQIACQTHAVGPFLGLWDEPTTIYFVAAFYNVGVKAI
jgi:hypothetical protein